jgi:hypothetical protein
MINQTLKANSYRKIGNQELPADGSKIRQLRPKIKVGELNPQGPIHAM